MRMIPTKATLKTAKATVTTSSGVGEIRVTVPGTPGSEDGRYVAGGTGWFENPAHGDWIEVEVQLPDQTVIGSFSDTEVPAVNQGWYIPKNIGYLDIKPLDLLGFVPAGSELVIKVRRASGAADDTFWCNINWGKNE